MVPRLRLGLGLTGVGMRLVPRLRLTGFWTETATGRATGSGTKTETRTKQSSQTRNKNKMKNNEK